MYQAPVSSSKKSEQEISIFFLCECRVLPSVFRRDFTSALPCIIRHHSTQSCTPLSLYIHNNLLGPLFSCPIALMAWFTTPVCAVILNRVIPIQYSNSCRVRNEDKAGLDVASLYLCITILKSREKL